MGSSVRPIDVVRVSGGDSATRQDVAAAEEPLEVRLHGSTFVVTMRTPGADRDLVNVLHKRLEKLFGAIMLNTKVVKVASVCRRACSVRRTLPRFP